MKSHNILPTGYQSLREFWRASALHTATCGALTDFEIWSVKRHLDNHQTCVDFQCPVMKIDKWLLLLDAFIFVGCSAIGFVIISGWLLIGLPIAGISFYVRGKLIQSQLAYHRSQEAAPPGNMDTIRARGFVQWDIQQMQTHWASVQAWHRDVEQDPLNQAKLLTHSEDFTGVVEAYLNHQRGKAIAADFNSLYELHLATVNLYQKYTTAADQAVASRQKLGELAPGIHLKMVAVQVGAMRTTLRQMRAIANLPINTSL